MAGSTRGRREQILTQLLDKKEVMVKDLASRMGVSEATVRRDLRALAGERRVELVYGGAKLPRAGDYSFRAKSSRHMEAKQAIGALAAGLVADGDHLLLDSGSTCFEMVPGLRRKRGLSVITNSSRLVEELAGLPGIDLIILGGQYRPDRMDTVGPLAHATLDQLRGYTAFIGADGLGMEFGPAASDIESADLYRLAAKNGRETVLLADHSKFQTTSLFRIVAWNSVSRVVTDRPPGEDWKEFFEDRGIELLVPEPEKPEA